MANEDLAPYLHNYSLKQAFKILGLVLDEVMELSPFDLDLENTRLENLLDFVGRYRRHGSREAMEAIEGEFFFPPIFPGIDPDSDWYRFEFWLQGQPTAATLDNHLSRTFVLKSPMDLNDEELSISLQQLEEALNEASFGISLNEGIPTRLVYEYWFESLGETFDLSPGGGWSLDGCSGYCPDCFQRPWCETGASALWPEDEDAGKMFLIEQLDPYVCASPQSLSILQRLQAEKDAQMAKFEAENPEWGAAESDWRAEMNRPVICAVSSLQNR